MENDEYDPDAPESAQAVLVALRARASDSSLICMTRAELAALEAALPH